MWQDEDLGFVFFKKPLQGYRLKASGSPVREGVPGQVQVGEVGAAASQQRPKQLAETERNQVVPCDWDVCDGACSTDGPGKHMALKSINQRIGPVLKANPVSADARTLVEQRSLCLQGETNGTASELCRFKM